MNDTRLPRPVMRDSARARLRGALMSEAVRLAEERRARRASRFGWIIGLRPVALAAALALVLVAGAGAAAASSLPGDAAFGLKRAAEQVELTLARSDDAKVKVLADQAQRRLDELARSATRDDRSPTASVEYEKAVERFAQAVEAVRAAEPEDKRAAVETLVEAARDKHVKVLEQLKDRVPEEAQQGIERAIEDHGKLAAPGKGPSKTPRPSETPRGGRPAPTR
ncbi:MAG: hypothetical protein HYX56_01370 [Chloroflexi bacterium]|nr:hypothetical protein [Chloroflexota bacterium]